MIKSQPLSQLLKDFIKIDPQYDRPIAGLAIDSRDVQAGFLFIALQGQHYDGRIYTQDAIKKGAVATLVQGDTAHIELQNKILMITLTDLQHQLGLLSARFYDEPSKNMVVIGITGTNGKTSTSHFIASGLQQNRTPSGIIGTLGNGLLGHLQQGLFTTPQPIELQVALANCRDQGAKAIAMEVSSHALDQDRVYGVQFQVAVFTNLTRDHLDYHGSMEAYSAAKRKLFTEYQPQFAVINRDDAFGVTLCHLSKSQIFTYGIGPAAADLPAEGHVIADAVQLTLAGIQANIQTPWGNGVLQSPLLGRFNLSNLLAALTTLCVLNVPFADALCSINQQTTVLGRMQTFGNLHTPRVVVDYAHTPDALEKALKALREHCHGVLWCVFGCGGDRDRGKRPVMAQVAEQFADRIIVTDDNPRTEIPAAIVADIVAGFSGQQAIVVEHNRARAISYAVESAQPGDIVLVAGKGHEDYQQVGQMRRSFSDIGHVKALIG